MKSNKYWFRKRRGLFSPDLGWGWTPITWEGWLLVLGNVLVCVVIALNLNLNDYSPASDIFKLVFSCAIVTGIAIWISIKKCRPND